MDLSSRNESSIIDSKLKTFICVTQNLSFTKASQLLFISQPSVTNQIKTLEKEYDIELFRRKNNGKIELTAAGLLFYENALKILSQVNEMEDKLKNLSGNLAGSLKIAASTSIAQYVIPPIIADYKLKHPALTLTFLTGNSGKVIEWLDNNEIDLGLIEDDKELPYFKSQLFTLDELVLIYSTKNLIIKKLIDSEDLYKSNGLGNFIGKLPLIMREFDSGTRNILINNLEKNKIKTKNLNIVLETNSTEVIKALVEAGLGVAFVSKLAIKKELRLKTLSVLDLPGLKINRPFNFIYKDNNYNNLLKDFIKFAKDYPQA